VRGVGRGERKVAVGSRSKWPKQCMHIGINEFKKPTKPKKNLNNLQNQKLLMEDSSRYMNLLCEGNPLNYIISKSSYSLSFKS
jgi:hypothetical protein